MRAVPDAHFQEGSKGEAGKEMGLEKMFPEWVVSGIVSLSPSLKLGFLVYSRCGLL